MKFNTTKAVHLCVESHAPVSTVQITDGTGACVYARIFEKPSNKFCVNLPKKDTYKIHSNSCEIFKVYETQDQHRFEGLTLPAKQWVRAEKIIRIVNLKNSKQLGPAQTDVHKGIIYLNPSFWQYPKYIKDFILAHEEGHLNYMSEHFCDMYAVNKVMKNGGNLSCCMLSLKIALKRTPNNIERTKQLFKKITENGHKH